MADISKIKIGNTTYNIKDTVARTSLTQGSYGDNNNQTPSYGDTFKVPSISVDENGRITSISEHTVKIPISDNTDSKVKQEYASTVDGAFPVLISKNGVSDTTQSITTDTYRSSTITINPKYGELKSDRVSIRYTDNSDNKYYNSLISGTLSRNITQTLPATTGTVLNTGTTSYTQTVASNDTGAYTIGTIKINNTEKTIYGKDANVYQEETSSASTYPILFSTSAASNTSNVVGTVHKNSNVFINPSESAVYAGGFNIREDDWSYTHFIKASEPSNQVTHTLPTRTGNLLNDVTTTFTADISAGTEGSYKIGTIKINDVETPIYGKDTHASTAVEHYGIKIAKNDSNPETRCTYMYDCANFTPFHLNFVDSSDYKTTPVYNEWRNAFFMLNHFPCMVKSDGTIDYKLSMYEHRKKEDGTTSDACNLNYDGNAQVCFDCKIYTYFHEDEDYEYYEFSNIQFNHNFTLHSAYKRPDGTYAERLFYPMYMGTRDQNGKLRSMSSQHHLYEAVYDYTSASYSTQPTNWPYGYFKDNTGTPVDDTFTAGTYYTRTSHIWTDGGKYRKSVMFPYTTSAGNIESLQSMVEANGSKWMLMDASHKMLLDSLLMLIAKNDDTQSVFGCGVSKIGNDFRKQYSCTENIRGLHPVGHCNMRGRFGGYRASYRTNDPVKAFFIENWWGSEIMYYPGLIARNKKIYKKESPPYYLSNISSATAAQYTSDYDYTDLGVTVNGYGWIKKTMSVENMGRLPIAGGGTATTYTCDNGYFNTADSYMVYETGADPTNTSSEFDNGLWCVRFGGGNRIGAWVCCIG